jgi:hypothetical protein
MSRYPIIVLMVLRTQDVVKSLIRFQKSRQIILHDVQIFRMTYFDLASQSH